MIIRVLGFVLAFAGFILLLGAAGSDCDGKCMENALPIIDVIKYAIIAFVMMGVGGYIIYKTE